MNIPNCVWLLIFNAGDWLRGRRHVHLFGSLICDWARPHYRAKFPNAVAMIRELNRRRSR